MEKLIVEGGRLKGKISVSGSKNAALPIIFASMLVEGVSVIENMPNITDVDVALQILQCFGAVVTRRGTSVIIESTHLAYIDPPDTLSSKIRASSYLIGASLGRFGRAKIQPFGGCNFQNRPIDMHLYLASRLGADVGEEYIVAKRLVGCDIIFPKISVGATVNAILASARAHGTTRIFTYAKEPHVISLVDFLRSGGINITLTDECITIVGGTLHSATAKIIPDMIEAGTYLALSAMTGFAIKVVGADANHLRSFLHPLSLAGIEAREQSGVLSLVGRPTAPISVKTAPYPAFPTDLQPLLAPVMASFCGGEIFEGVWQGRFGYLTEMAKFGVKFSPLENGVRIYPSRIINANATAPDLRGGAALLLCALSADGVSEIYRSDIIKRGYGGIVEKLRLLGANIEEKN